MGQQQLLLIVLGCIIVGIAVYSGTQLVTAYQQENERDLVKQQINILVLDAKKYAAKTTSFAGGQGKLTGYQPPADLATTDRVRIYTGATDGAVTFSGFGSINGSDGQNPVHLIVQYTLADNRVTVDEIN